jgi:hypothetical protein
MCAGIATCGNRIYASELDEHRLQVFRLDGSFVRMLGKGSLDCPSRIAATEERVFVACLREGVALSQAGELLFRFYPYHDMPPSLGLAKDELLVVVPNRLCVYDARDGTLLRSGHVAVHAGVILLSGTATVCPCLLNLDLTFRARCFSYLRRCHASERLCAGFDARHQLCVREAGALRTSLCPTQPRFPPP